MVQLIYTFSDGVCKNSLCSCVCWGIWFQNSNLREAKISCKTCPVDQEKKIQDHFPISTAVAQNGHQSFEFCLRQEKGWLTCEPSLRDHNPNLIYSICTYVSWVQLTCKFYAWWQRENAWQKLMPRYLTAQSCGSAHWQERWAHWWRVYNWMAFSFQESFRENCKLCLVSQ